MPAKIITSNIRFDNPEDGHNDWNSRKQLLTKVLLEYSADLICTQEGRRPQLDELDGLLKKYKLIDDHRRWIPERMYPCIYHNPLSIEIFNSGDYWLSTTPHIPGSSSFESAFPRLFTWAKGRIKRSAQKFFLANVHMDHSSEQVRSKQVEILIQGIKEENAQDYPLILCGDFNEAPGKDVQTKIFDAFPKLYDPWEKLDMPEEPSHHNFGEEKDYLARIDWILLDEEFTCDEIDYDKSKEGNVHPSDHYPVKAQFSFKPS